MAHSKEPRYLSQTDACFVRDSLEVHLGKIRVELIRRGADPRCFDHEIGIMLARAACRLDLDLLQGASKSIERLEAVVAEMGAKLEQAKIATSAAELRWVPRGNDPRVGEYVSSEVVGRIAEIETRELDESNAIHRRAVAEIEAREAELAGAENGTAVKPAPPHEPGCLCDACRPRR